MELWRDCAHWLARFDLIHPHDPVLGHQGQLADLVALLRDGVLLCQLIHRIDPDAIDMSRVLYDSPEPTTGRAVSDFLCRHNIFLFLHSAVSQFNLDMDEHFFRPEELYQCKNVASVLESLSVLSHCPRLKRLGIPGFPRKEKQLAKKLKQEQRHYEQLNQLYGEAETEYLYDSFSRGAAKDLDSSHYEDIYQTIFPPKQPRLSLDNLGLGSFKKSKRSAPMHELLETEDKYLENLIMVRDVFRDALPAMSPYHKCLIFYQWDDLVQLHSDLLFGLKQKKADVGHVFLVHMEPLSKLYGLYCVNLPVAMEVLEQLQQDNATLRKQIYECQLKAKPATFPLSSHLVIPFQRFLKYHLLLKEILKLTPDDYSDHVNIADACQEMLKIGQEVNERKREHEEGEKQAQVDEADMRLIENVRQSIKLMQLPNDSSLLDFGRLRKAGDVTVYNEFGKIADYVFLFDMVVVLCHKPRWLQHRYRFREAIRTKDFFLEPVEQRPITTSSSSSEVFSVRLFRRVDARKPPVTLLLKTSAERDAWFHAILLAMDAVNPSENTSQGHVLQLNTFFEPTKCYQCDKVLQGKFFQGYRCLRCQVGLHKACIADCTCLEIGGGNNNSSGSNSLGGVSNSSSSTTLLRKAADASVVLPTAMPDSLERSNSTLSLTQSERTNSQGARLSQQVQELQDDLEREMELRPVEEQPWYAGPLSGKVASDRLESLPVGTFLVRRRANGLYALMLKTPEEPKGVKAMAVHKEQGEYFFSGARRFDSVQKLVAFYRTRDLTENFDYPSLRGVTLKVPYKSL